MQSKSILYIPHGGGPMPLLGDPGHASMVERLQDLASAHALPSAILVISAHWEAKRPTVNMRSTHELLFDYAGFPSRAYALKYPAAGEPELAGRVFNCLSDAGLDPAEEHERGIDHGVFVPLVIMYPEANVPVVELSLVRGLDPVQHIEIGKALAGLDWPNLLVIGSGMSFHNPGAIASPPPGAGGLIDQFYDWLEDTLVRPGQAFEQRANTLASWEQAPAARFCHPREEHLIPLHVCFGMTAGDESAAEIAFTTDIMGTSVTCLKWQMSV